MEGAPDGARPEVFGDPVFESVVNQYRDKELGVLVQLGPVATPPHWHDQQ